MTPLKTTKRDFVVLETSLLLLPFILHCSPWGRQTGQTSAIRPLMMKSDQPGNPETLRSDIKWRVSLRSAILHSNDQRSMEAVTTRDSLAASCHPGSRCF